MQCFNVGSKRAATRWTLSATANMALRYLDTYEYEVAILDWRMPRVSGLEVVQRLRRRNSALPVLMLTAQGYSTGSGDRT